ncbi:GNAT family N-acetyltransferase [Xenorhabdus bovienii]|uniref:GNAT family N-acetyltransferase n=1 Tax=Xenorhabdus bovienii TaxID=40576 RepID=UPI003DA29AFD
MNSSQKTLTQLTNPEGFIVTNATLQDWQQVITWENNQGWDISYQDISCIYNIDPKGFFIGRLNDKPIAAVSLINHSDQYAIWGNYIVIPEFRGNGYGRAMCKIARPHAGHRDIGSNSMPEMTLNYMKSGLVPIHDIIHYIGNPSKTTSNTKEIIPIKPHHLNAIIHYDALYFPTSRKRFLKEWLFADGHTAYVKLVNGNIYGYGVIRPAPYSYRIDPLVATTPMDAEELFNTLTAHLSLTDQISISVPENINESFSSFLHKKAFYEQLRFTHMHKGTALKASSNNIYALAGLELG